MHFLFLHIKVWAGPAHQIFNRTSLMVDQVSLCIYAQSCQSLGVLLTQSMAVGERLRYKIRLLASIWGFKRGFYAYGYAWSKKIAFTVITFAVKPV